MTNKKEKGTTVLTCSGCGIKVTSPRPGLLSAGHYCPSTGRFPSEYKWRSFEHGR